MRSTQAITKTGTARNVTNQGWEVSGSYVLTGEGASDRGVRPNNAFDPAKGNWGALQIAARYSALTVDLDVFTAGFGATTASRQAKSFTLAANWYPAAYVKYYATFERTSFEGGNATRATENVILFRV